MNEDVLRILRMLEEGKFGADEAARLIEALGEDRQPEEEPAGQPWGLPFEDLFRAKMRHRWPPHTGAAPRPGHMRDWAREEDPFEARFDTRSQSVAAREGMTLQVHHALGSVNLVGSDGSEIVVEGGPRRHFRIEEQGDTVTISARHMSADLTVRVPAVVDKVVAVTDVGQIQAQGLADGDIQLSAPVGQIAFDAGAVKSGSIRLRSDVGGIMLRLPANAACDIRAVCDELGEASFDPRLQLQVIEEGSGLVHGQMNGGGADIRLLTDLGQISVGLRE